MESDSIRLMIRDCIKAQPRGFAAKMAMCTALTETEISFFVNEARPLPPEKVLALGDWLLASGYIRYDFVVVERPTAEGGTL